LAFLFPLGFLKLLGGLKVGLSFCGRGCILGFFGGKSCLMGLGIIRRAPEPGNFKNLTLRK